MTTRRRASAIAVATMIVSGTASAGEGARDPVAAEALFERGQRAIAANDPQAACPLFAASLELDPAVGTLFNLADCEERVGKLATAWERYKTGAASLPEGDERGRIAAERARALEPRLPRLALSTVSTAKDARVYRDGVELRGAALGVALPVDPGPHVVALTLPNHARTEQRIVVAEGESKRVVLEPGAEVTVGREPPPARGSALRTAGFFGLAAGGVLGVVGLGSGLAAFGAADRVEGHCDAGLCDPDGLAARDDAKRWATVSTISFVAAGAALAFGVTALILAPRSAAKTTAIRF